MLKKIVVTVIGLVLVTSLTISLVPGCSLIPTPTTSESRMDTALLEEVWDVIYEEYVERDDLDADTLIRGAIKGMVDALDDPYSSYLDADTYEMSISDLAGKFEGIGAYVGDRDGKITIIAPIPDSPADKAGIRSGDIIVGVDGESTTGWSVMDAVIAIRGPRGTPVRLLVLHEGGTEPVEIEVIRAEIEVPSVHFEMVGNVAHIVIIDFSERTSEELSTILEDIAEQGATGIILDLRGNPGGLLSTVVDVASRFLERGVVVSVVDNEGHKIDSSVRRSGEVIDLPMVVLVNEFSASGSEVLAGTLQDHDRAVVAGATTFGKGSVNILRQLSDGSGLYITVARWYTPGGRLIEGEGIEPDYVLDPEEDPIEWALEYLKNQT